MTNIFENAKFGDKFITDKGTCALFLGEIDHKAYELKKYVYDVYIQGDVASHLYDNDGNPEYGYVPTIVGRLN